MVPFKCFNKHLFEVHPQCFPQTRNPHPHTIWLCGKLLPPLLLALDNFSLAQEKHSCTAAWDPISDPRCHINDYTTGRFPNRGSSPIRYSYGQDSCIACPYHQGPFTSLYRLRIPCHIRYQIPNLHLLLPHTSHFGRNASLLSRIQRQCLWDYLRLSRSNYIRYAEHLLETIIQRSCCSRSIWYFTNKEIG
jgi:hypothetical protein